MKDSSKVDLNMLSRQGLQRLRKRVAEELKKVQLPKAASPLDTKVRPPAKTTREETKRWGELKAYLEKIDKMLKSRA